MDLAQLPTEGTRAVLVDLDDTLTWQGVLVPEAHTALARLKERGLFVVIVSGRPAGWADCLTRLLPIDAMIFENGAGIMRREGPKVTSELLADESARMTYHARLNGILTRLRQKLPQLRLAKDQHFRLFDFAIDYAEEPPGLAAAEVDWILSELAREHGVTAKLSSIHINFWCGTHTKLTAVERLLSRAGIGEAEVVYCGDSPNDEPLFARFPRSVGVANVATFLPRLAHRPVYLTKQPGGLGFAELAGRLTAD